jgi:CRP/FNR family transcriptional regulator, dissimilatory nitrate respiration regulator
MDAKTLPLPAELDDLLPPRLHAKCAIVGCAKGTRLFEAGRRPVSMFYVGRGEVTLERPGIDGNPIILQRTRHGFVGEASLQSARYHCDAIAVADSEVTKIPVRELRDAMEADPAFSIRWIAMLNREVKRLRLQCERLTLKTVEARLLHLLETEGDAAGYPLGAGLKSIAREIGVTHEALYRCVADLERRRVLHRTGERLRIVADVLRTEPSANR